MQHLGRQRVGPLRYSGPPRPVPLPERPPQGKLRTDSTYDWREIGEQVTAKNPLSTSVHVYPIPFGLEARRNPPFPSDPTYDAKAWEVAIARKGAGRVVFWNVTGPVT
jgi:hypothetical protein